MGGWVGGDIPLVFISTTWVSGVRVNESLTHSGLNEVGGWVGGWVGGDIPLVFISTTWVSGVRVKESRTSLRSSLLA